MSVRKWLLAPFLLVAALCPAVDDPDAKRLPDGPGKDAVVKMCFECHDSGRFRQQRVARDVWSEKVSDMVDRGASGTEAEITAVVDYLTRNFGPSSKMQVNSAPMVEIKAILELTAKEASAIVAYRDANGSFKQWQDLQKVPEIDAKKIEAKKDLLAF
jgi:competence ComEA-like helix-hairpin-helix protein